MKLSCGHKQKRIIWALQISVFDPYGRRAVEYSQVCPKCYHRLSKDNVIESKRIGGRDAD